MMPVSSTNTWNAQPEELVAIPGEIEFEDLFCQSLMELQEILQVYAALEDPLSNQLYNWGEKWQVLCPEHEDLSFEKLCARAGNLLSDIKYTLGNPYNFGKVFQQPLYDFENDRLWEEANYRQFKLISPSGRCPFSQALPFQAQAHPFAKAMAEWVEKLDSSGLASFFDTSDAEEVDALAKEINALATAQAGTRLGGSKPDQKSLSPLIAAGDNKFLLLMTYNLLAKKAVDEKPLKCLQHGIAEMADAKQASVSRFAEAQLAESNRNKEAEQQRQEWLDQRLQELEGSYQDVITILQTDISALQTQVDLEQTITNQKTELLAVLESQMSTQMAEQAALERSLEQEAAARIAMQGQLQQQLLEVTAENSAEQALLQEKIASLNAFHASELTRLEEVRRQQRNELTTELGGQIDTLRAEIITAKATAERQHTLIAGLEGQVSASVREYAALQQQCELRQQETRTRLQAEMAGQLEQHAARQQQLVEQNLAELARMQQQYQQQLQQRVGAVESAHRNAQNELRGEISQLNQKCNGLLARVSTLSGSLANESQINQQLNVKLQNQQAVALQHARRIAALAKPKKKKKFLGLF